MHSVPAIIDDLLGGATAISNETGIPLTTVHSWKRARFVPSWRIPALLALADRIGRPLCEDDFPKERPSIEEVA
jgi:hypothetical protein